jgi:aldehyde:ferredoxin oxidoreductase
MGSKKLRAIVVRGTQRQVNVADADGLKQLRTWFNRGLKNHQALSAHHELGTSRGVIPLNALGILPTHNFQDGSFEAAEQVCGEAMQENLGAGTETCYACGVSCKRLVEGDDGKFAVSRKYGGPEYETIGTFGPNLGVDNITAIAQCNERCNALGLDTISTGVTLGWAIECFERGLLTAEDTGGIPLRWNDPETYLKLLNMIALREGFGDVLAEGSLRAARTIGKGTEQYVMHVKGQEFPAHEPRGKWGVGLGYAVSPTGADHLQAAHDHAVMNPGDDSSEHGFADLADLSPLGILEPMPTEDLRPEKVRLFVYLQYIWSLHDVIDWCIFTNVPENRGFGLSQIVDILGSVTGWRTSVFELMKAGERALTMARAFNCREGLTADDDRLPERMFEPMREGALKGHAIDRDQFAQALQLYYGMMGWNEQGVPTQAKLVELDIGWIWEQFLCK